MNKLPLIEKIHLLESKLGDKWTHTNLEPFKFDSSDSIKVQEAGKKLLNILAYLLSHLSFRMHNKNQMLVDTLTLIIVKMFLLKLMASSDITMILF